jgi:capsular exopolysaccharide synthesis family protein
MSRYFETLKEVSRTQNPPVEAPAKDKIKDVNGWLDAASVESLPPAAPPVPPAAPEPRLEVSAVTPQAIAPQATPTPERGNKLTVRTMPFRLDPKLPLMPHTEDKCIVEQYRKLRTKIQQESEIRPIRSMLVASPGPGEGKTLTVLNLALSFGMLPEFRVLVLDGDIRKGSIAKWMGLTGLPGLSNLIDGSAKLEDVIIKGENFPVHCITAGTSARPAAELLTSPALGSLMNELSEHFDLVLMDSPPVNLLTDAQMLAANCDAVILVARAFVTTNKAMQKTLAEMSTYRLIGTVLNGGMRGREYKNYYGY